MGQLAEWRKQNWVRIGTDGAIKGPCGTSKDKKNPDRCLPESKAKSLSKKERATTARKKKAAGARGQTVVANTKKAKVRMGTGGNVGKKFGMDDNVQTSYEKHMQSVIEKNMKKQNRVKLKGGGFIAKGCGAVLNNRRKVTTRS